MAHLIEIRDLRKIYAVGDEPVAALDGVSLSIDTGEFVAIMGASGSGKSTLLNILGCLDTPTSGSYLLDGIEVARRTPTELAHIRNRKLGFVFQNFNLLARTSAIENVELPDFYLNRLGRRARRARAMELLERVGLGGRGTHTPAQLSGGQQQRVAIARALMNEPPVLFADEPTGNLDTKSSVEIMNLFTELSREGITIVMVTHEDDIAAYRHSRLRQATPCDARRAPRQGRRSGCTARLKPSAERAMIFSSTLQERRTKPAMPKPRPGTARISSSCRASTNAMSSPPGAFGKK